MSTHPDLNITFADILAQVDTPWLMEHVERLWKIERGATFRHWHQAAQLAESMLRDIGLERVERIAHPADGKTAYLDRRMPMAWDVTRATLTVKRAGRENGGVVASFERHPFHVIKGSVGTPPEGIVTRLISEQQLNGGEEARGAMVILEPDTYPRDSVVKAILDQGAIGFVDTNLTGRYDTPDGLSWPNAVTEGANWHVQVDDRPFLGFVVSPREGDRLREAVRRGGVTVHAYSDARRYEGELHTVTAVLPGSGEDPREMWITAHLYEPMPDDNSAGVIGSMEVVRLLKRLIDSGKLPRPRFDLRVVFTAEMYGYAAYAALRGVPLRDRVVGAVNFDGMLNTMPGRLFMAPPGSPFCGDYVMERVLEEYQALNLAPPIKAIDEGMYGDDQFLNDPTTGVATLWLIGAYKWWHNSSQCMATVNPDSLSRNVAFYAAWFARMLNLRTEQKPLLVEQSLRFARRHVATEAAGILDRAARAEGGDRAAIARRAPQSMQYRLERELGRLLDFDRVCPDGSAVADAADRLRRMCQEESASLQRAVAGLPGLAGGSATAATAPVAEPVRGVWAAGITPRRIMPSQPYDLAKVPKEARILLPGHSIYGPFATVLARIDGKRNLKEIIDYAEWETGRTLSPRDVRTYISALEFLATYGYVGLTRPPGLTRKQVADSLRAVGIREGDLVLIHSKMSAFGHIEGGAETVLDGFLDAVGPRGTLILPTFGQSAFYVNGESWARAANRPFDIDKAEIWVGQVPQALLRRRTTKAAGASGAKIIRGVHPTHSVAGVGPLAEACIKDHLETDSPTGSTSAFAKLVEHGGKMVWFGADLGAATFLHYLEDVLDLPYLQPAVCRVQRPNGKIETVFVHKHLPGCRDFYSAPGENTKIYKKMLAAGLTVRQAPLGLGTVKEIDAGQMNDLGLAAIKADPWILLCDRPDCLFCRGYKPL